MTYARSEIVDPDDVGVYHCVSRCVRRAFLCGFDPYCGRSFEHRRLWIRARLKLLSEVFAIEVIAYAIMINHLHSLLRIRPDRAKSWSPEEVARRWRLLFPRARDMNGNPQEPTEEQIAAITSDPEKVELYRERLSNLSWFNRCLNENIARSANREDDCSGRFWEGRFKCQRIYDVGAVVACATYIDLNPIRAGAAKTLATSEHTSIQDRIHARKGLCPQRCDQWAEVPLVEVEDFSQGMLSVDEYLTLVDQTGRIIKDGKGQIPDTATPVLERLALIPDHWVTTTKDWRKHFKRIGGSAMTFELAAKRAGKHWFQGKGIAAQLFI